MVDYAAEIKKLKEELAETKRNKRTEGHIGLLRARIAKLEDKEISRSSKSSEHEGYSVKRSGDATVVLFGFPSSGKSTLLNALTKANSETAEYAFTTVSVVPGILEYNNAKIQILDLPGIVEGAASGRGRGREVLSCVRGADLALILVDVNKSDEYEAIKKELWNAGIRINQHRPFVKITKTKNGGIVIRSTVKIKKIQPKTIKGILKEFKYNNCEVTIHEDIDIDDLIDIIEGNRKYMQGITIITKIDLVSDEKLNEVKELIKPDICISAKNNTNIETLKKIIFERLDLIRVFLKEYGKDPDLEEPMILKKGSTIKDLCEKIHRDMTKNFRFARVWGTSAKFPGQRQSLNHRLEDMDIVEIREK